MHKTNCTLVPFSWCSPAQPLRNAFVENWRKTSPHNPCPAIYQMSHFWRATAHIPSLLSYHKQVRHHVFLLRFVPGPLSKYSCAGGSKFSFHYSGFSLFLLNFFGLVVVFSFSLFLLNFSEQVAVLIFSLFLLNFSARQVAGDQHSWPWGGGSRRRGSLSGNYSLGEKQPSVILWESI